MYIVPNTTIKLIRNCPIEYSYENTIFFNSEAEQTNYFINVLEGYKLQNNSYQRVNKGKMRVAVNAEFLYTCNYLAFQNASFGNKWFYAFITNVEYVNNTTSEVTYEIDVIQTWHFNYLLMPCFVEREHSLTDEIGDNLVPESLDTGEFVSDDFISPPQLDDYSLVFWTTFNDDATHSAGGGEIFNNGRGLYYSGLIANVFPLTPTGLNDALSYLSDIHANRINGLVNANIVPDLAWLPDLDPTGPNALPKVTDYDVQKKTTLYRKDGTQVKNKKCLTYPFNALYVTNNQGKSAIFRYEFFDSDTCRFRLFCDISSNPTALCYPLYYKGVERNFDEKIDISGFPQVSLNIDSYKAWLAQTASSIAVNGMTAGMAGEAYMAAQDASRIAVATGGAVVPTMAGMESMAFGIGGMAVAALAKQAISGTIHAFMAPQSRGHQGSSVLLAHRNLTFNFMHKHITPEFATIIDDYFNAYGYATHTIKVPYRTSRPEWNYVKTVGCKIDGGYPGDVTDTSSALTHVTGLPADDMKKIEEIYDNGITFWHNPAHVGDYTQDNSPVVPT